MRNNTINLINKIQAATLNNTRRGVERECLRITPNGHIAETRHPIGLGSSLTNPTITTDYSEAMVEIITPPFDTIQGCVDYLDQLHTFVYNNLENDELLWTSSMPCILNPDTNIPPAHFGTSNEGKVKELYRKGLKTRYGCTMQSISGIHFNFSFPDSFWEELSKISPALFSKDIKKQTPFSLAEFRTAGYLHLTRNFLRTGWILTLLFGTTPALCTTYLGKEAEKLDLMNKHTAYLPFATSLRSSHLGYQSPAQKDLFIATDTLSNYCHNLKEATLTPWPEFSKTQKKDHLSQINGSILQIENEFYSSIRPKQATSKAPRTTTGLGKHGIEYIEVRSLDINPYEPVGISVDQIRFTEALLLNCLLNPSPPINANEYQTLKKNTETVATRGRKPEEKISSMGTDVLIKDEAFKLINEIYEAAEILDQSSKNTKSPLPERGTYTSSINLQTEKISNYSLLPSSRILATIRESKEEFFHLGMRLTTKAAIHFREQKLTANMNKKLKTIAVESIEKQENIESAPSIDFNEYLKVYTST